MPGTRTIVAYPLPFETCDTVCNGSKGMFSESAGILTSMSRDEEYWSVFGMMGRFDLLLKTKI